MKFITPNVSSGLALGLWLLGFVSVAQAQPDPAPARMPINYSPADGLPLIAVSPSKVCAGVEFYDGNGDKQTGTLDCTADLSNLLEGNIKSGVNIAGVDGKYPSAAYSLDGSTSVADLTAPTFDAKMKSDTKFEWFDSEGKRYEEAGDSDLNSAANIADGVTIFGMTGAAANVAADAWDIRAGIDVPGRTGVKGKLKVACRNAVRFSGSGVYNNVTAPASSSTTASDIWDTIDDYHSLPSTLNFPSTWSVAENYCGNADSTASSDDDVWVDVTTADGTTPSTCGDTPTNCTMKDRITGLKWSKFFGVVPSWQGSIASPGAIIMCHTSTHNGQLAGAWRLPTQKELLDAYNHGIAGVARTNWITRDDMVNRNMWGATYGGASHVLQWVNLANGRAHQSDYNATTGAVCVQ